MKIESISSALVVAVIGLLLPALLVVFLVIYGWKADEISTVVGLFTGLVGTLVGAFLGVQVGSSGRQTALDLAQRALAALPPEKAAEVLRQ